MTALHIALLRDSLTWINMRQVQTGGGWLPYIEHLRWTMRFLPSRSTCLTVPTFILALLAANFAISPSVADTGLVRAVVTKGGFIIGVGGGTGTLVFRGKHYPLQISGVSFGATIGASTSDLRGHAYNMHAPTDIEGAYSAIGAGAAIAGGAAGVRLQNAKGVVLELTGVRVGAELSAAVSGVEVRLR
jgi:hypothetical protein